MEERSSSTLLPDGLISGDGDTWGEGIDEGDALI